MSGGPLPSIPAAPDDSHGSDAANQSRTLTPAEIEALREFFLLLDEWDRKKKIV